MAWSWVKNEGILIILKYAFKRLNENETFYSLWHLV